MVQGSAPNKDAQRDHRHPAERRRARSRAARQRAAHSIPAPGQGRQARRPWTPALLAEARPDHVRSSQGVNQARIVAEAAAIRHLEQGAAGYFQETGGAVNQELMGRALVETNQCLNHVRAIAQPEERGAQTGSCSTISSP